MDELQQPTSPAFDQSPAGTGPNAPAPKRNALIWGVATIAGFVILGTAVYFLLPRSENKSEKNPVTTNAENDTIVYGTPGTHNPNDRNGDLCKSLINPVPPEYLLGYPITAPFEPKYENKDGYEVCSGGIGAGYAKYGDPNSCIVSFTETLMRSKLIKPGFESGFAQSGFIQNKIEKSGVSGTYGYAYKNKRDNSDNSDFYITGVEDDRFYLVVYANSCKTRADGSTITNLEHEQMTRRILDMTFSN